MRPTVIEKLIALVVDDDALSREALVGALHGVGWMAYEASDETSASEAMQALCRLDLLLTVVASGNTSKSWNVAELGRDSFPSTAVIYASRGPCDVARAVKDSKFVSLPFNFQSVLEVVQELTAPLKIKSV